MIRPATAADAEGLAELLLDAVAGGASVSFMADFTPPQAIAYWRTIIQDPLRVVLVAGKCDGTATLILETPPNQPHRADLAKMLCIGEPETAASAARSSRLCVTKRGSAAGRC
ncbi:MAG: hypothetical protein LC689_03045 [Myxococcales bacterium]|nr:hypothetical protein [Myxococcales bacterium]